MQLFQSIVRRLEIRSTTQTTVPFCICNFAWGQTFALLHADYAINFSVTQIQWLNLCRGEKNTTSLKELSAHFRINLSEVSLMESGKQ